MCDPFFQSKVGSPITRIRSTASPTTGGLSSLRRFIVISHNQPESCNFDTRTHIHRSQTHNRRAELNAHCSSLPAGAQTVRVMHWQTMQSPSVNRYYIGDECIQNRKIISLKFKLHKHTHNVRLVCSHMGTRNVAQSAEPIKLKCDLMFALSERDFCITPQ